LPKNESTKTPQQKQTQESKHIPIIIMANSTKDNQ